ncbi:glycosyltransferase [Thauera sp. ZXT1-4]
MVIPSFNHARFLLDAIESVLAQSVPLELIIWDDASQDDSWSILTAIDDPRVRVYRNASNRGAHYTLHRALEVAQGDYLAILNSDDRFRPDRLSRCVSLIQSEGFDLVGTDIQLIDASGQAVAEHWWVDAFEELKSVWNETGDWVGTLLEGNVFMTTSNFVFSRVSWERFGPFSSHRYVHDYDFVLRVLAGGGQLGWIEEKLLNYRLHDYNTISTRPLEANLEASALLREHLAALLGDGRGLASRIRHLNSQWGRIERYENEILAALQHDALVRKDAEWKRLVDDRDRWIAERDGWIAERDGWIAERDGWIAERDALIAEQQEMIAQQGQEMSRLGAEVARFIRRPLRSALSVYFGKARHFIGRGRTRKVVLSELSAAPVSRVTSFPALKRLVESRASNLKTISFDVFDTLLSRCIEPPGWIVKRVAEDVAALLPDGPDAQALVAARTEAEAALRAEATSDGGDHECHHDDLIAEWVARIAPGLSAQKQKALAAQVEEVELAYERLALRAKPEGIEFLRWAHARGLRLIAVSDMYLGERHLKMLLDCLGYEGLIDRVYVSSEHRVGKYSGRLFNAVLEAEGVTPSQLLHVGDNLHSDMIAPSKLGVTGVFLDEPYQRHRRRRQQISAELACSGGVWPGRMLAEIIGERLHDDERATNEAFFFQYGLEVLGPIFSCFTLGLVERVRATAPECVYFLARDGDLFQRMYERWSALAGTELPPAKYAYASRRVVACAAVAGGLDHVKALVALYNPKQCGLKSILKTYGLAPDAFSDLAREHGFEKLDEPLQDWHDSRLLDFLGDTRVQERIRPVGEASSQLLFEYFEQLGFFSSSRVALVDIGWNATIQRFMEQAFGERPSCRYPHVDGYYLALVSAMHGTALRHGSAEGLLLDQSRNSPHERAPFDFEELFEQGARALHATTVGYRRSASGVEPVLKDDDALDRQAELRANPDIEAMQRGALLCLEHFVAAQRLTGFRFEEIKPYVMAMAERAVVYPSVAEVAHIGRLAHTEDFGHDHLLDLAAAELRLGDLLRPRQLMQKLGHLPWRYAPFARFRVSALNAVVRTAHLANAKGKES